MGYLMGYNLPMAQPARKPKHELPSEHLDAGKKLKVIETVVANENESDEAFLERTEEELAVELDKLGTGQPLEVHMRDIKALRAFRNAFPSIKNTDPENLNIYVINPDLNVAITRAFGLKNSKNISFLTKTHGEAEILEEEGYKAKKGLAEGHRTPERVNIMVVMDSHVRPTPLLLSNVAPGGWVLWPAAKANALRGSGKYKCMGILEGGVAKDVGEDFWKNAEVSDEELRALKSKDEGVVTYEEAAKAVWEAFGKKHDIVKEYKRLIEMVEEKNSAAVANGVTKFTYSIERDGKTIEVPVKTVLPLKETSIRKDSFAIFKKNAFV